MEKWEHGDDSIFYIKHLNNKHRKQVAFLNPNAKKNDDGSYSLGDVTILPGDDLKKILKESGIK
jgi:hypothetical protein